MTTPRNIVWLSLSFLLTFFAFDGVQQFLSIHWQELGQTQAAFVSLVIVYAVFTVGNPAASVVVHHLGAKRSMMLATIPYAVYLAVVTTGSVALLYAASAFLGLAASVLWIAQNSYLVRASDPTVYGRNAGVFSTCFSIGATLGVILFGWLRPLIGGHTLLWIYASIPLIGMFALMRLDDLRAEPGPSKWTLVRQSIASPTAWRIGAIWFVFNFIQGLMLGVVPLEIKQTLGLAFVGILVGVFYITPMLFSYWFGRQSDRTGRIAMVRTMYALSLLGVALLFGARQPILLISGIVCLALNFGLARTITFALVGDLATPKVVESLSALFWMIQSLATMSALLLSTVLSREALYWSSLGLIAATYLFVHGLLQHGLPWIRARIAQELTPLR